MWVQSHVGEGSDFHFSVPFAAVSVDLDVPSGNSHDLTQLASRVTPSTPSRVLRVLLAEDNLVNQKLIATVLHKQGHSVVVAENGDEAVAAVERQSFDVILMDVQMPQKDGLEATVAIREAERVSGAHVPIVALTAHAMKGDEEKCLQAGMDDYLTKPLNIASLRATLEKWTREKAPAAVPLTETRG
jgi:CheY-like chemotaxis protein